MFNQILRPMLLKEVDKPFYDYHYLYELKYDGIRVLIYVSKNHLKIITRNGRDVTHVYPELQCIQNLVGKHQVIFDGEIVAFFNGKPSFNQLLTRHHLKNESQIKTKMEETPVCFVVFDILYQDRELIQFPLIKRKNILKQYLDSEVFIKAKSYQNGLELFKKVKKLGLEGIVAKEKNSVYIPNTRVDFWLKIKNFKMDSFFVHGYLKLKDKYRLLLGEYRHQQLFYVGNVSVTKDNSVLNEVKKLKKVKNQFVNANPEGIYIEPKLTIQVYYMERTSNHTLRQPFVKN